MSAVAIGAGPATRPWGRAALWLLGLAPFFYLTYGLANGIAASRQDVPSVVFDWERHIPFLPWTIVPYWSVNLLYGGSLFVCATREELDRHGLRLLTAQVVATLCFVLFPLRFSFPAPPVEGGLPGFLFDALRSFDRPFNQAPSLHIALLVILWALYRRHVPRWTRPVLHVWFVLIGLSVLTTFQHHAVDIPTGALLGLACLWVWPRDRASPLAAARWTSCPRRRRLAAAYTFGAVLLASAAALIGGPGLLLWWPAVSVSLVALTYAVLGPAGFQKGPDGAMSVAARWLYAPYLAAAWINSRLWTRLAPDPVEVAERVFLGRVPGRSDARTGFRAVVDLSAELPKPAGAPRWLAFPLLDLATPDAALLRAAARAVEAERRDGSVLVCCALGFSRSAAAVATWLLVTGRAPDVAAAEGVIRRVRPRIVLGPAARAAIARAAAAAI